MDREELMALLDTPSTEASALEVDGGEESQHDITPASETALKLDDWSMRRGRELLEQSESVQKVFELPENVMPEEFGSDKWDHTAEGDKIDKAALAAADFHAAAFEPDPQLAPKCKNERIGRYMKNLLETPEFKALHNETQLDECAAELATASFAKEYVALCKTEEPNDDLKKEIQAISAAGKALAGAQQDVGDLRDAQSALGIGGSGASPGSSVNAKQLSGLFKRVRGSKDLKRICELAGRYRMFAQAKQRKKVLHGRDDVVGVVLDNDLGRMLPHELAQLADPDLELDVMRRLVERQTMCRDHRGIESKARGPIVVVVDESGSMGGEKIYTAKAMALAFAWIAKSQRRWYTLVGFSGGCGGCFCVAPPDGTPRYRDFENEEATEWVSGPDSLLEWLEHFYSGGTTLDVPLEVLPKLWEQIGAPKGKTDIITITDAIVDVPASLEASFNEFRRREQVKMVTLVLNNAPGDMTKVSDRVHCVKSLSLEEEAVGEALGV